MARQHAGRRAWRKPRLLHGSHQPAALDLAQAGIAEKLLDRQVGLACHCVGHRSARVVGASHGCEQ